VRTSELQGITIVERAVPRPVVRPAMSNHLLVDDESAWRSLRTRLNTPASTSHRFCRGPPLAIESD
jgi:hypothetical protein